MSCIGDDRQYSCMPSKYGNTPSYRVGFDISETLVSYLTDESLKDNAQGTTNFAADGADRLKVTFTF